LPSCPQHYCRNILQSCHWTQLQHCRRSRLLFAYCSHSQLCCEATGSTSPRFWSACVCEVIVAISAFVGICSSCCGARTRFWSRVLCSVAQRLLSFRWDRLGHVRFGWNCVSQCSYLWISTSKSLSVYECRMPSSVMLRLVALVRTDIAPIIRVTRIGELGKTLAVTSNRNFSCKLLLTLFLARRFLSLWWWGRYVRPKNVRSSKVIRHDIPEYGILHSHRRETLKSYACTCKFIKCTLPTETYFYIAWNVNVPFLHVRPSSRIDNKSWKVSANVKLRASLALSGDL
jgi:hypothetical protein